MTHPFHESIAILSDFVRAASDPLTRSPSARKLRRALEYLALRCDKPAILDALKDLDETPPRMTYRVTEAARELLVVAESSSGLTKDEQEHEAKKAYLQSSQYAHERAINWAFTVFAVVLLIFIARHVYVYGLTTEKLKTMAFLGFVPLLGVFALTNKPSKPFGVFNRFFAYRARTGCHGLAFRQWTTGRGHGVDARPTRRQAFILFMALYLVIVFGILYAPY